MSLRGQLAIGLNCVVLRSDLDKRVYYVRYRVLLRKAVPAIFQVEGAMQPDTSRRVTNRVPLVTLTSFRAPVRSHPVMEATPVLLSNIPSVFLTLTLLAALIGCGQAPSKEVSRSGALDRKPVPRLYDRPKASATTMLAKSFFGTLKNELVHHRPYHTDGWTLTWVSMKSWPAYPCPICGI